MNLRRILTGVRRYCQSLVACGYFFGGGFLLKRHRGLLYTLCRHFGFDRDRTDSANRPTRPLATVPMTSIHESVGPTLNASLMECEGVDGNVSFHELAIISALVRMHDPKISFEIGTFDGRSALNIALNCKDDGRVFTLDLPMADSIRTSLLLDASDLEFIDKTESGMHFRKHALGTKIRQLYGDSASFDFTEFHGRVDFMLIDGAHSYDYARFDSLTALKLVRPGGIIVWHDYDTPFWHGVTAALNELRIENPRFRAIQHIKGTSLCILIRSRE